LTASFNAVSASQQQISASYIALSASYNTFSGSASTRITVDSASLLQVSSSQQQISASYIALSGSYNVFSGSNSTILTAVSSSQQQISASYIALSGSYNTFSGSASTRTTQIENVYATTGSNSFRANQSITGSLVVSSTITAQTLVVQTVTSSIVYSSGSNIFGCDLNSRQVFTGSFFQTGSLASFSGQVCVGSSLVLGTNNAYALYIRDSAGNPKPIIATAGNTNLNFYNVCSTGKVNINNAADNAVLVSIDNTGAATFACSVTTGNTLTINGDSNSIYQKALTAGSALFWDMRTSADVRRAFIGFGGSSSSDFVFNLNENGAMDFATCNTQRMRITSCGKVGIIATDPKWLLEICCNTTATGGGGYPAISINNPNNAGYSAYYFHKGSTNFGGMELSNATCHLFVNTLCTFAIQTSGTERLRISLAGTSTFTTTENQGGVYVTSATDNTTIRVASTETGGQEWRMQSTGGTSGLGQGKLIFKVGGTETASYIPLTLTTDNSTNGGRVGIGTTTPAYSLSVKSGWIHNYGAQNASGFRYENDASGHVLNLNANNAYAQLYTSTDTSLYFGTSNEIRFKILNTGIACFSSTVCAPCFATISDYRMKSNIRPIAGLSIIMNTKPYKFEYNYDCSTSFGMIAHELQDTLPEAVFGQKDGEVMQGVDYMKLLPITIKAIQEQQCTICSQASMINTLKTCLGIA